MGVAVNNQSRACSLAGRCSSGCGGGLTKIVAVCWLAALAKNVGGYWLAIEI